MVVHRRVTGWVSRLWIVAVLVAGCTGTAPTPQIVYITAPPVVQPTPQIVYVTPVPASAPASASASASTHAITGTLTLVGGAYHTVYNSSGVLGCDGGGPFADVTDGAKVTVRDGSGSVTGLGSLTTHTFAAHQCVYGIVVNGVLDAPFYTVEVGARKGPSYSRADLEANGWQVDLTLGS